MATLQNLAEGIVKELTRIQGATVSAIIREDGVPLPRLIATGNGRSLVVSKKLDQLIATVARQFKNNQPRLLTTLTDAEWTAAVRKAFGPVLVSLDLDDAVDANVKKVLADVKVALSAQPPTAGSREYSFGCALFGNSDIRGFDIGPVRFEPRLEWLDRKAAENAISKVTHRRVKQIWNGKTPAKRKRSRESVQEQDLVDAVGGCPYVCSVKVAGFGPEAGQEKALTAARLALATIALVWETPSKALDGFNLSFDRAVRRQKILTFAPGMIVLAGSKLPHSPHGPTLKAGEWEKQLAARRTLFSVTGEILDYLLSPDGNVGRPKMMNALAQSLLWFHEGCREGVNVMAIVKFSASMDALASGKKADGIRRVLDARLGWKDESPIHPGGPTMGNVVDQIYSHGRSRTIHGTNDKLGYDWTLTRGLGEQFARFCLLACIDWAGSNRSSDDPALLAK